MRKRILSVEKSAGSKGDGDWLDLGQLAEVELSSEHPEHPIEAALIPGQKSGWQAADPGRQLIRLVFSPTQQIKRIQLHFEERSVERRQEYVLQWSPERGQPCREIVRQQWNFSPGGASVEIEDHQVDLPSVAVLELIIDPDPDNPTTLASMESMRIA